MLPETLNIDERVATLQISLSGSHDVDASLLTQANGGRQSQRGLDGLIQEKTGGSLQVEIIHQPGFRSDLLLQQLDGVPLPDSFKTLGLADNFTRAQFQSSFLAKEVDVVILSIVPDLTQILWRHKQDDFLFCPPVKWEQKWTTEQQDWFKTHFSPTETLTADQSSEYLTRLVQSAQERGVEVLIYGASTVDPEDRTFDYYQLAKPTPTLRIHRFDYALLQISLTEGVAIIDVDRILGEMGARAHVVNALHYSPEAYQRIQHEVFRVLEDMHILDRQLHQLKLLMPFINNRIQQAAIVKWHKSEGDWIDAGDPLFDIFVDSVIKPGLPSRPVNISMNVTAVDSGFLRQIMVAPNVTLDVGQMVAMVSREVDGQLDANPQTLAHVPEFRLVATMAQEAKDKDRIQYQLKGM